MREPVGVVEDVIIGASGAFGDHEIRKSRRARWLKNKPPVGTKLYCLPPDAEEEIRYLRSRLADATKANDLFQTAADAEIERLREALQQIANRAIPIQREEHRIARTALAKEDSP
jgi:hypothetical protein